MKLVLGLIVGIALMSTAALAGQDAGAHVALARAAAGDAYQNLFNFLCTVPTPRGGGAGVVGRRAGGPPPGPPDRSTWYAEPVKVFDNLYFVGQSEYSAWAVTTTEGIILIDTLFDYSVEEEVAGGLKKLGLNPDHDPLCRRHASSSRPPWRREVPSGSLSHTSRHVRGGLGCHRSTPRHEAHA